MSAIIAVKHDKGILVEHISRLMYLLTKDAIPRGEWTATAAHLHALRDNAKPWEVSVKLQGDVTGRTILIVHIVPRG